jgi:RNA polymerase-binding transcription factor DksA
MSEWHAEARELVAQGMSQTAVAKYFRVTPSAVTKAVNPERAKEWNRRADARPERKKAKREEARKRLRRGGCEVCGKTIWLPHTRCPEHSRRMEKAEMRRKEIIRLYEAGVPLRGIAAAIGTTMNVLSGDLVRIRKSGYPLPYRNRGYGA